MYDLQPAPEANVGRCYTSTTVGFFVSGVGAWSWTDTKTYNDENVWHNLAMEFEEYDMDICAGHAASGVYHRKSLFHSTFAYLCMGFVFMLYPRYIIV